MKRVIGFFVAVILLIGVCVFKENDYALFNGFSRVIVVSEQEQSYQNYLTNGNQYYYIFDENADVKQLLGQSFVSYNFYYSSDFNIEKFISNLDFCYQGGDVEGYKLYYGYYCGFNDFRYVDGKKVNIQIALTQSEIIVGLPLITTGY